MKFVMKFDMDGDTFYRYPSGHVYDEFKKIFNQVDAKIIEWGDTGCPIIDSNGNTIGYFKIKGKRGE